MENEISVVYNLPKDWDKQKTLSFEQLSQVINSIHESAYSATVKRSSYQRRRCRSFP